jgi:predicted ATP-dependent endonuclease of OLD family
MPILTFIGALSTGKSNILRSLELFWNPEIFKQELELAEERAFYSSFQENKNDNIDIEGEWVFNLRSQKEFFGLFFLDGQQMKIIIKLHGLLKTHIVSF